MLNINIKPRYDTLLQDKNYCILNIQYWLLFHICVMPIRPFQKFRKQQEAVFGGTCDGVLYDVDISKENTKDIFWFTVFAVRQEGLCYTCFLLFIYQSKVVSVSNIKNHFISTSYLTFINQSTLKYVIKR